MSVPAQDEASQPQAAAEDLTEQDEAQLQLKMQIADLLEQSAQVGQMTEQELETIQEQIQAVTVQPLAQQEEAEPDLELETMLEQLANAQAAVEDMSMAYQAQREGWLDQLPQTGKENSWRYQNGERLEQNAPAEIMTLSLTEGVNVFNSNGYWGIDVSHHQGEVNWEAVKAAGIDFAVIRCGYGDDLVSQDDRQWHRNVSECERLGIPYGVYLYSYATDTNMAASEAAHTLRLLEGHNPDLPVFYDMEENRQLVLGVAGLAELARTYCDTLVAAGYDVGVYASLNWWQYYLTDPVFENWYRWIAEWRSSCTYTGRYEMWQYTDCGTISGINGVVDMNYWYEPIGVKEDGLYKDQITGEWHYYKDGKIARDYTGLVKYQSGSYYYVDKGVIDWGYTGIAQYNQGGYYYVKSGKLDWGYSGMASGCGMTGYIAKGRLDTSKNGLIKVGSTWYNFEKGAVLQNYTGLVKYKSGSYYYVNKGIIDWGHTGIAQYNQGGYYYVKSGKLDWSYSGMATGCGMTAYIAKGRLDTSKNGLVKVSGVWYNFEKGVANTSHTGLAPYQSGSYYYVNKGQLNYSYTGMATGYGLTGYVVNGRLDTSKNGLLKVGNDWYNFKKGLVDTQYTGLVRYQSGSYYYVNEGVLDRSYTGITRYQQGGYYYVKNGKLDRSYTGLATGQGKTGYIVKGCLDSSKNGAHQINNTWYTFQNGWVV
ncbi:GH25 family lysozyme [uncultured Allofournierella sp.]|uniref:GH25 family lysozyme n=1 Tax=uncultured Allofournierella sp. TaxID=1940258 RepID=UPI0037519C55